MILDRRTLLAGAGAMLLGVNLVFAAAGAGLGSLVGAVVPLFLVGFLVGFFVQGTAGFWGSIAVAFVGACALIALVRALGPRTTI